MKKEESTIHGSMMVLVRKFIISKDKSLWEKVLQAAGLSTQLYDLHNSYPLDHMERIIEQAAFFTGKTKEMIKENFGEFLVPDLMKMYKKYINPDWRTFDVLLYTEMIMHRAVRIEESEAQPPVLSITRVHDKMLAIDYYSERKMACLGIGIIKGIARYYGEDKSVKVVCLSDPNAERVRIRVEFK